MKQSITFLFFLSSPFPVLIDAAVSNTTCTPHFEGQSVPSRHRVICVYIYTAVPVSGSRAVLYLLYGCRGTALSGVEERRARKQM